MSEREQALENCLRVIFCLIEEGILVRDTSNDGHPHWAFKQVPLVRVLAEARELLGIPETTN